MLDNDFYTDAMKAKGLADAQDLQARSATMDGTALYAEDEKIPDFVAAKELKNMLQRLAGFVCKSTAGRVVKLLQVYDSEIYPQEPEELPAQWAPYWSKDPQHAVDFIAIATAPWMIGDCCKWAGHVYRCKEDNVVWSPGGQPQRWEDLGTVEEIMEEK